MHRAPVWSFQNIVDVCSALEKISVVLDEMRAVMDAIRVASSVLLLQCCEVAELIFCIMSGVRSISSAWVPSARRVE